jgi:2-oxoglutarate dehydrogenase E2 component (dihydrolipoamide succinyltransferase)
MKVEMLMPQMGESIAEATISKWRKKPGDTVQKDEVILEISTDKVDSEIPAPAAGVLAELLFQEGDVVPVKTKIAIIDTAGGSASVAATNGNGALKQEAAAPAPKPAPVLEATPKLAAPAAREEATEEGGRYYSPLVKGLAEKHGVSLAELGSVAGSGQGGRVTKEDFLKYVETRTGGAASAPVAAAPSARPAAPSTFTEPGRVEPRGN